MKRYATKLTAGLVPALLLAIPAVRAEIPGIGLDGSPGNINCTGTTPTPRSFNLMAGAGHIALGDGNSLLAWGYGDADGSGEMQYPGPTIIVCEGDPVTINLTNELPQYLGEDVPTSIVFPGQLDVVASNGAAGLLTQEVGPGDPAVTYSFTASSPGTYMYESGTQPELQIEMGLVGALIVRPRNYNRGRLRSEVDNSIGGVAAFNGHNARQAYRNAATRYEREYLYFLTDMDSDAHWAVERDFPVDPATFFATSWFVNGRNGPDTLHPDFAGWLPNQPYGALTQSRPGERVLMRLVGAGRDLHPFHHHGNNAWIFAKDGQLFGGSNEPHPDLQHDWLGSNRNSQVLRGTSISNYTIQVEPGSTYDAIFTWTGAGLNWDIYGNDPDHIGAACGDTDDELAGIEDMAAFTSTLKPTEDPGSHCKPLQVVLPEQQSLTFGGLWTGSPYLGGDSALPPGEGGLNPNLGFSYIWHSHTEKELVNDDIFPGGMMTFIIVEPPTTCIVDGNDTCPE